jgi:hypothetical protein
LQFLERKANLLFFLKALIYSFSASIGLNINFQKSMIVPTNISDEKLDHLARTFGSDKGSLPSTYLGLPLGITKPKADDLLRKEQNSHVSMWILFMVLGGTHMKPGRARWGVVMTARARLHASGGYGGRSGQRAPVLGAAAVGPQPHACLKHSSFDLML